jgi:hypothetical protein
MPEGKVIKVKPVSGAQAASRSSALGDNRLLFATVAYHFPQYNLQDVAKLPHRDVELLLHTAHRIEAERMYNLTLIASAPQSKDGKGVRDLLKHFKELINK